jgi:hypothetical protein
MRRAVFYQPGACAIGFRDIIAAWLVCLVVAATGFAYTAIAAASERPAAEACAVSQYDRQVSGRDCGWG